MRFDALKLRLHTQFNSAIWLGLAISALKAKWPLFLCLSLFNTIGMILFQEQLYFDGIRTADL